MSWLSGAAANIIGAVDSVTPGRLGQTLNTQLRDPTVNWKGAANPNHPLMNGITSDQYRQAHKDGATDTTQNTGSTSFYDQQAAKQRQAANLQIEQINRLLGTIDAQKNAGLQRLEAEYGANRGRLTEDQQRAMNDYAQQFTKNDQNRQKGVEQVDDFANNSFNNLRRILQGANAGSSSVMRELVPQLVSKGAGTRRQGVFDTAGENAQAITTAKKDAETQFARSFEDLDNQKRNQESQFRTGVDTQYNDLLAQRLGLEQDAGIATDATRSALDSRTAQLNALFGQFAPQFSAKAVNLQTPELSQYQMDPAQIRMDQGLPQETRAYLPSLRKREEELRR